MSKAIAATYRSGVDSPQSAARDSSPPPPKDRLDALKKLQNTRSNITKWKKKEANAPTPADQQKATKKLEQLNKYKNSLEIFLKDEGAKVDNAGA
ncbi:MAG: hypothetical protein AAFZ15_06820 [Bacteroidota bacterium]